MNDRTVPVDEFILRTLYADPPIFFRGAEPIPEHWENNPPIDTNAGDIFDISLDDDDDFELAEEWTAPIVTDEWLMALRDMFEAVDPNHTANDE